MQYACHISMARQLNMDSAFYGGSFFRVCFLKKGHLCSTLKQAFDVHTLGDNC